VLCEGCERMKKIIKSRTQKAGLPPGTLVHLGERREDSSRINIFKYSEENLEEKEIKIGEIPEKLPGEGEVLWVNIDGLHEVEIIERIGEIFSLHPLVLEDILSTDQRPKVEDYGEFLFLVLPMFYFSTDEDTIIAEQVSLILGNNFIISFQEQQGDVFSELRRRLRTKKGLLRRRGADYLFYGLLDSIVDAYFLILEKVGEDIEAIDDLLLEKTDSGLLREIHRVKREMIFLRRSVWPLREAIAKLERRETTLISESTLIYLRDVYDHVIQIIEAVETSRDLISGIMDIYLSTVSNRMNEVMKVLTIIATIFIPLTFVAGIYGMNFVFMPELEWSWGYPLVLLVMGLIALGMILFFRRKRWF